MYLEDHARAGDKTFHPDQAPDDPVKSNFPEPNSTFFPHFFGCRQLSPVVTSYWRQLVTIFAVAYKLIRHHLLIVRPLKTLSVHHSQAVHTLKTLPVHNLLIF